MAEKKKNLLRILGVATAGFTGYSAYKASKFIPEKKHYGKNIPAKINADRCAAHLSEAIKIKTVSHTDDSKTDWNEFNKFHKFLESSYPLFHKNLSKEVVGKASLLYKWEGTNPALKPMAMLSHMDVVPVPEGTETEWRHPAFDGFNDGEFIWGRGSLDMKNHLICVMEAAETMLEEGFRPERTIYFCFGHNEEIADPNNSGAAEIVKTLKSRGIYLDSCLDEGGALLRADIPGVIKDKYIMGIGIAEKGYCDYKITVRGKGGHSSQAPKHNLLGKTANVIRDLEAHQFKSRFLPQVEAMFTEVCKNMTFPARMLTCHFQALKPLALKVMENFGVSACFIRTTTGVSMCEGSPMANVLPEKSSVTVNFRPLQGENSADVAKHIRKAVRYKDAEIELLKAKEPSRFSPCDSHAFKVIEEVCNQMNPGKCIVVPYIVMGETDAYHYEEICTNVLRFAPFKVTVKLISTCHAVNERVPVSVLGESVEFFKKYMEKASKA